MTDSFDWSWGNVYAIKPEGQIEVEMGMTTGEMPIGTFLDALAGKQSTPGGGGAAALTGSQGAALISMVVNFTLGNKRYADVQKEMEVYLQESEQLRHALLELADADVAAFGAVSACYGMPRGTDDEKAARTSALQEALQGAAKVPFETAQKCLAVMTLAEPVGRSGNTNVVSDAAVALYLAHAGLLSAIVNVNINLKFIKDAAFVEGWSAKRDELLAQADVARERGAAACTETLGMHI